ncbi:MAG: FtsX-like permease family protein, partial [Clostridiales bacterium]|nr:FtsX-like permease family protein [Clostridiales bacterium]
MTLFKLSLRNAKRQARDYLVYLITVTLSVALIYAFNGLIDSPEIKRLSEMMDYLMFVIIMASIAVVFVVGWLVHYTTRFLLLKRSRELGTYILLGMEQNQVSRLFFMENITLGGAALAMGILLGNLFFQFLRAILLAMFDISYRFNFSFSAIALGLTLLYFALIYLFALLKGRRLLRRMKISALLNYDRRNETEIIKNDKSRRKIFALSLV